MARKKTYDYFKAMHSLAAYAAESAQVLNELITEYSAERFEEKANRIHELEHQGDQITKETMSELFDSFITPIDREDIVQIINHLDDVLDDLNATTYLFENLVIQTIRPDTDQFLQLVVAATQGVVEATSEFSKFKNSKTLKGFIQAVNETESQADELYSSLTKRLFTEEKDPIEVIKWYDVYKQLEAIIDDCEDVADSIEGIVIKNT